MLCFHLRQALVPQILQDVAVVLQPIKILVVVARLADALLFDDLLRGLPSDLFRALLLLQVSLGAFFGFGIVNGLLLLPVSRTGRTVFRGFDVRPARRVLLPQVLHRITHALVDFFGHRLLDGLVLIRRGASQGVYGREDVGLAARDVLAGGGHLGCFLSFCPYLSVRGALGCSYSCFFWLPLRTAPGVIRALLAVDRTNDDQRRPCTAVIGTFGPIS